MQNVAFRLTMTMKKSLKGWAASVLQRIPWQNRGVAGDSRETYHKLRLKITGCFLGPRRKLLRVMDSKASAFNSSNNSSFSCPDTDHVLGVISFSVVFVLGCLGNFLLLAVILRKGGASNVTNLFHLNLLVADLIRIFSFVPIYLAYTGHNELSSTLGLASCKGIFFAIQCSVIVSVQTLFFSSLERHQAVVHPLKEKVTATLFV